MKFSLYVNQKQATDLGIANINQAHVFDLLSHASTWATPVLHDGEVYYFTARQKVCTELPLIGMKPDTVYRHFKKLQELGLIDYRKDGKKDLTKLTELGKTYHSDTMSEMNPSTYVGNESEKQQNSEMNPRKLGNESEKDSDLNPTYKNNQSNTKTKRSKCTRFKDFWDVYPRKENKKRAKDCWQSKNLDPIADKIIDDVLKRQKNHKTWLDGFIPHASTYLNGERWDDEIKTPGNSTKPISDDRIPELSEVRAEIKSRAQNPEHLFKTDFSSKVWGLFHGSVGQLGRKITSEELGILVEKSYNLAKRAA